MEHRGIELEIGRGEEPGTFTVQVLRSSGGRPRGRLELDVGGILSRRNELQSAVLTSAVKVRRIMAPEENALQQIGQQLFEALFAGPVDGAYRASQGALTSAEGRLRVGLQITAPELAALPWEAMFDPQTGKYVCLDEPLIRQVDAPFAPEPLDVRPPVRILGLVAAPRGLLELDVREEQENLGAALADAQASGLVQLTWAPDASWRTIHDLLLKGSWNVLHFIGHGNFDATGDEGQLALVGPDGGPDYHGASQLADLLSEADPTPRLVVLNACAAGQSGAGDLFSGTATALVRGGVSAVAAMQFSITDQAAIAFSRGFYTAIARGRPVDMAARSGRIEIRGLKSLEWVTPVLYARSGVGELFRLQAPPAESLADLYAKVEANLRVEYDEAAIGLLQRMLARQPQNSEEQRLLGRAQLTLRLTQAYVTARRAEQRQAWGQAAAEYGRIVQEDPAYRDAQARLSACRGRSLPRPAPPARSWTRPAPRPQPAAQKPDPAPPMPSDKQPQVKLTKLRAPGVDVRGLAEALGRWYEGQELEVIQADTPTALMVQCRTPGSWKRMMGLGVALTVTLRSDGDDLLIETGAAKWLGKRTGVGVGLATHGVGWVTVAVGAWRQYKLPRQTITFLRMAATTQLRGPD